ncbi:VOC family protein, partial [Actinophytocola sp.]|uniref:VOC family protein n=1 Tax=Actinophytocola sp. TaxID=1872138 RepID=UPI00389A9134
HRQGDIANITMVTADAARAKNFYETVLEVPLTPGRVPNAWSSAEIQPRLGIWSPENTPPQVQLCYRVDNLHAAVDRVRTAGGTAAAITREPYGLMAECTDDQGTRFQLWQPAD